MMGTKDRSFAALPPVTLEDLIPPDSFYRHLERSLDLGFVRDLVRATYAETGRPSIDPVVFFKLHLILFFEGLRSERQLMQVVADRLSLRWYLGYDLTEPLPDHSSLSRIRERYGLDVFRSFFELIVEKCLAAGLVWGQELYIDATKVAANAALDSLQPRFAVAAHLAQLFAQEDDGAGEDRAGDPDGTGRDAPARLPIDLTDEARSELAERAAQRHDWIGRAGRPDRVTTSGPYRTTADFRVSTTDSDATPIPPGEGRTRLGYQDHYVVDGGRARIILITLVPPAEVQENQPALDLLWHVRFRWKLRPHQITGDTKYGTVANIVAIENEDIRAYVPLSDIGRRVGIFGDQDFRYDAEADVYHCPGGAVLRFLSQSDATHRRIYQAPAAACKTCALREQCTSSPRGRRVSRSLDEPYVDEPYLDRVRGYPTTEPYAKAMRKRQVWVEPLFAEAKTWHGLRRFRLRGLAKVNGEALLIATGQNLQRLLSRWGWGRRPFPSGAAGAVLVTLRPTVVAAP
jgi:transposase